MQVYVIIRCVHLYGKIIQFRALASGLSPEQAHKPYNNLHLLH